MKIFSMTVVMFLFLIGLGYAAESRFGLFLVTKYSNDLEKMELANIPLITEADIIEYDWVNHALRISEEAAKRFPTFQEVGTGGKPFVIVADGKPAYQGAFWIQISSIGCTYPVIDIGVGPKTTIKIERGYPSGGPKEGCDPRDNEEVRKVLRETGKLKDR